MFEFLKSKSFLFNVILSIVLVTATFVSAYYWLGAYTNHGETIVVPEIRKKQMKDIERMLSDRHLKIKVADSSVFIIDKPGGMIVEQDPPPGTRVKENRTIYVTITKIVVPQVKMPAIIDVSDRQAEAILLSYGLKTGDRTYKPDLAKNAVLEVQLNGKILMPGDEVPKGSVIDLVLGDGYGNTEVKVPSLINLTYEEARFTLRASSLAVGAVIYNDDVKDTLNAVVYRQQPAPHDSLVLRQGESVDLYLRRGN
jgi:eukaryotic-like serine/threonine-protein kinase